jgi:hypothetical protein
LANMCARRARRLRRRSKPLMAPQPNFREYFYF